MNLWVTSMIHTSRGIATQNVLAMLLTQYLSILDKVGFVSHPEKPVFIPTQVLTFLGFLLNSVTMTVQLTPEQAAKIRDACLELKSSNNKRTTIWEVARVIGLLTSSFSGVQFGPLHYRHIEWDKTESLKSSKGDFDRKNEIIPSIY